jgi:hypothetical protein
MIFILAIIFAALNYYMSTIYTTVHIKLYQVIKCSLVRRCFLYLPQKMESEIIIVITIIQ